MVSEDRQFEIQTQTQDICILVQSNNDMTLEEDESFVVTIIANPPVNASLSRLMASVIIRNDDSKYIIIWLGELWCYFLISPHTDVTITFEESSYSVVEGSTTDVCLLLNGNTDIDISVTLQVEETTASMY